MYINNPVHSEKDVLGQRTRYSLEQKERNIF